MSEALLRGSHPATRLGSPDAASVAREQADADQRFARSGAVTLGFTALTLAANVGTGVLIARVLGASGRGELTAITVAPLLVGWVLAFGCYRAVTFHQARHPEDAPRLIGTWLAILVPLGVLAIVIGELVLPAIFSAQTDAAYRLAQLYMLTVFFVVVSEVFFGVLMGDHDFLFSNAIRFAQPAAIGLAYVLLWGFGDLSVGTALAATAGILAAGLVITAVRALRRHGIARPSLSLGRATFGYGLKAHATSIGEMANLRLDLLIIPAFLAASSVGLYAVAISASSIISALAGALALLMLPISARQGRASSTSVIRSLQTTIAIGAVIALLLGVLGEIAIRLVYGGAFVDSVLPLRLLLPGCVFYAGASVLCSALCGLNRPFAAAAAQAVGLVVTLGGLLVFLEAGGITAAALVSTASYATVFLVSLVLYLRVSNLHWRVLLLPLRTRIEAYAFDTHAST